MATQTPESTSPLTIAVTGSSGKLGSVVVRELRASGHTVIAMDVVGAREPGFVRLDLLQAGDVMDALAGVNEVHNGLDAVVHLGAIPAPGLAADSHIFRNNLLGTFNVLQGARRAGIRRIVTASSETTLGIPFDVPPPYLPIDEVYDTRPESMYALTKHLEEQLALKLVRWDPELSITALRFSNVMVPSDYAEFPSFDADPMIRKWNAWGYIDARDGAQAVERALTVAKPGFEAYIIAAADTVMSRSSAELAAEVFPSVPVTKELGEHETLLSIDKARRLLGYEPRFSWRDA
jgi:UDP-glucose 4-epimerase